MINNNFTKFILKFLILADKKRYDMKYNRQYILVIIKYFIILTNDNKCSPVFSNLTGMPKKSSIGFIEKMLSHLVLQKGLSYICWYNPSVLERIDRYPIFVDNILQ